jgi:S-DNA-T family DNA segregation ATPase FtsK/SpoIIIE
LHAYQDLRIAYIRWHAGVAPADAEADAVAAPRRRRAKAHEAEEGEEPLAAVGEEALAPEAKAATALAATGVEAGRADAVSMEVDRPLSPEERSRLAEAFFKKRGSIKVSAGGPRVNEQASTQAVSGEVESSPQVASSFVDYQFPSMDLLQPAAEGAKPKAEGYQETSGILEKALASFGVSARVVEVCPGPSVTRYELALAPGVKMARVVNLADDIALASKVGSVRIEGPIQGRGTLGVEIPNPKSYPVLISELLATEEFAKAKHKLVFCVGKDIGGSMVFSNLAEMPHLLVAGATGSGKSVMINAIIVSILYRAAPDEVKLLMVDPKRVELTPYDNIPHLMRPVIANPKEAAGALRLLVQEMEERYKRMAAAGVRKIDEYNAWVLKREQEKEALDPIPAEELQAIPQEPVREQHRRMPYIVCVIDELADLMMVSANEVESSICRLAQLARAVGIHLVIATQRPSVDVVTGLIKSNLPSRIAFQVASKIDSRTILDGSGAEALLGKGDMLYSPGTLNKALRVQGCLVSNAEVEKVVAHVKSQAAPVFDERFTRIEAQDSGGEGDGEGLAGMPSEDPLYEDAVRAVLAAGQASTSVLQRRMRIGYGRAANLLDLMEAEGIIGPKDGNRPRKVLLRPEDYSIERPPEGGE